MKSKHTPKRLPPVFYDPNDHYATGTRIGQAIASIYGKPLSERTIPDPLPCSPCLQKGGR